MDQSNGELDDGVPYSVNCLAENIRIIHEHMVVNGQNAQARSVLKLADHIDLEKTRLGHYINQQQAMQEFQEAVAEAKRERIEVDREFTERLEKTRWSTSRFLAFSLQSCSHSTEGSDSPHQP